MKSATVEGPSSVAVGESGEPDLEPGGILVRMHACGICGSDVEKVFGKYGKQSMRLGHEPAGVIIRTGPDVPGFAAGDRVFTHHHVPCYDCHLCNHNSETLCARYSETNLEPCGLSEVYAVPAWNVSHGGVLKLADSTSFEEAAMIEPLACCVRAWSKLPARKGDTVAVFGVGPTGMMHAMIALSKKFSKVLCLDVNDFRLDFARNLGATDSIRSDDADRVKKILEHTGGAGVDVAIVATSSLEALADAIEMVRSGGHIMMFGVPSRGASMSIDMSKIYSKEITMHASYAASDRDTKEALGMIESSEIDVKQLITHTYTISDSQSAFEHARSGADAMKIIITKQQKA
ncbi:MAG: L-iditol 2-dehydrogenase [Nitrosopumilus sp. H8]|nr:MAG: L-iditol 2-dehydrogenase [Nitrosopumilus sp. H8]